MDIIDEKYTELIRTLNNSIREFNKFLSNDFQVPEFDLQRIGDKRIFVPMTEKPWDDFQFPNSEKVGVYFMLGRVPDNSEKMGLYIGKASFSDKIGHRLYAHLSKDRNNGYYTRSDKNGVIFHIEYVFSIDLETIGMAVFAPALEEFLISDVKDKIHLFNSTGNK